MTTDRQCKHCGKEMHRHVVHQDAILCPEPTHCARCGEAYADHWGGCELVCPRDVPYADKHKYYPDEYPALTGKPYTPTITDEQVKFLVEAEERRIQLLDHNRWSLDQAWATSWLLEMNAANQSMELRDAGIKHEREDIEVSTPDNGDCTWCGHRDCDVCTARVVSR